MTATISEVDTAPFDVVDFEAELACEADNGCSLRPDWRMRIKCCDETALLCDEHFWRFINANVEKFNNTEAFGLVCAYCLQVLTYKTVSEWVEAVRI